MPWFLDGHLPETRDTLQTVYDAFDADTKVMPGHGPVTDIALIKWGIDYLTAVETQVKATFVQRSEPLGYRGSRATA